MFLLGFACGMFFTAMSVLLVWYWVGRSWCRHEWEEQSTQSFYIDEHGEEHRERSCLEWEECRICGAKR